MSAGRGNREKKLYQL